jgi:hypothetical protein
LFAISILIQRKDTTVVKREFVVERQGKSFVLYAGLLDLAHSQGLRAIRTQILQLPSEENGQTVVVHAEVDTEKGTFHGIGDANPGNVARAMLTCTIRLAETRAKARALRDATNVGVAALEELGDLDDAASALVAEPRFGESRIFGAGANPSGNAGGTNGANGHANGASQIAATGTVFDEASAPRPAPSPINGLATQAQVRAIYSIARDQHGMNEAEVDEKSHALFGAAPVELTRKQASEFITSLKANRG